MHSRGGRQGDGARSETSITKAGKGNEIEIDLEKQEISAKDGKKFIFNIDKFRKKCLLEGLDDIGLTLENNTKIDEYESFIKTSKPWI